MASVDSVKGLDAMPADAAPETRGFTISDAYRRFVLGLLMVVGIFNFVDQQIFSILLQAIKVDLNLSDTQLGLLTGPAFTLFYALLGFPIAWLADRFNRRNIMALSVGVWSIMTAVCALATGFWSLFFARVGVAVGEAGGIPPSQSLVADYFAPRQRGTAMAVLGTIFPIGGMLGFLIGGWMTQLYGWRAALMVVGLPGVLLALILRLTLREPPRGHSEDTNSRGEVPPLLSSIGFFLTNRAWRHLAFGGALFGMAAWGATAWVPAFFIRVHHMSPGQIGTWLAFVVGTAGVIGTVLGGNVADRVAKKKNDPRWYMWVSGGALLAAVPFAFFTYLWPDPTPALLVMIIPMVLGNAFIGPLGAMNLGLAGIKRRAVGVVMFLFLNAALGAGLGPLLIGMMSDYFNSRFGDNSLRYSILTLVIIANSWAALHFLLSTRTLREDLARADAD